MSSKGQIIGFDFKNGRNLGFWGFYGFTTPENRVPLCKSNFKWPELTFCRG